MSWENQSLDNIITFQRGFDLPKKDFKDGIYPVVGSTRIIGYHNAFKVVAPCVVTGRSGTLGVYQYLEEDFWAHNTSLWVKDFQGNHPKFIFYLLHTLNFKSLNAGASVPTLNRNFLKSIFVKYPINLLTQKRIADILSAYDNLIENNHKRIKLLEQAAQNIYKEWFVNMRFPKFEDTPINQETGLPEGWRKVRSDKVLRINIGKTPPRKQPEWFSLSNGYKWVSISDMNKSSVYIQNTKERITVDGVAKFNVKVVPKGTVLLSFKLTIGSVVIATEDMVTNEAIAHFNIDKENTLSSEYTYCFLNNFPYKTLGSTSAIGQALNSKIVKSIPFLVPKSELVELFTKTVSPIFSQIENLITQKSKFESARDILLPRLMNRTIEV